MSHSAESELGNASSQMIVYMTNLSFVGTMAANEN